MEGTGTALVEEAQNGPSVLKSRSSWAAHKPDSWLLFPTEKRNPNVKGEINAFNMQKKKKV
jgi:hypothetical protein